MRTSLGKIGRVKEITRLRESQGVNKLGYGILCIVHLYIQVLIVVHAGASPSTSAGISITIGRYGAWFHCNCAIYQEVVFSEGELYLDNCDFRGSSAEMLLRAREGGHTIVRNAILDTRNCE